MGRREPLGGTGEAGGADIPAQGTAAGQLLGLLPAEAKERDVLSQGQLGLSCPPNKVIYDLWLSANDK